MSLRQEKTKMYLSQVKKGKSVKYKLLTDYELSRVKTQNRGLTILRAGNWDLDQQRKLATRYGLCKTEHVVKRDGEEVDRRVCGQYIRPRSDGHLRSTCGDCANREFFKVDPCDEATIQMYAPKGQRVLFEGEGTSEKKHTCTLDLQSVADLLAKLEEKSSRITTLELKLQEKVHHSADLMRQLEETRAQLKDALGRLDKGAPLSECVLKAWPTEGSENNYSKRTQTMAKSCLKSFARAVGLTLKSRRDELFEAAGTPQHAWSVITGLPDKVNVAKNLRTFYKHYQRGLWAQQLWAVEKENSVQLAATTEKPLDLRRRKTVEAIAQALKVNLDGPRPGKRLLREIQGRLMSYEAHNSVSRRWLLHQMLGFFLPAARDQVKKFKWSRAAPPQNEEQFREGNENLLCMSEEGKLEAVYFGFLKKTTTDRYRHLFRKKRFFLCAQGIQSCDGGQTLRHLDYPSFWCKVVRVVEAEYAHKQPRNNTLALRLTKADADALSEPFFGTSVGSQIQRIIFRNGYERNMPTIFYAKVMQHCETVDKNDYIKSCLMDGPWDPTRPKRKRANEEGRPAKRARTES